MPTVDGLPRAKDRMRISDVHDAKKNTQFVLTGAAPQMATPQGVLFLEYVQGTNFVVKDANGTAVTGTIPSILDLAQAPIRLDGGVQFTGTVLIAKGFVVPANTLQEI